MSETKPRTGISAEMKKQIATMWDGEGLSSNAIAKALDLTKNQVMGYVTRMGLSSRPSPIKAQIPGGVPYKDRRPKNLSRAVVAEIVKVPAPITLASVVQKKIVVPTQTVSVMPLVRTCQWINGDPRNLDFCGDPVDMGRSYCPNHCARAYVHISKNDQVKPNAASYGPSRG